MGTDTLLIGRTDTFSGKFLDNNIDPRDHPFILGITDPSNPTELKTFVKAGREAIANLPGGASEAALAEWNAKIMECSL